MDAFLKRVRGLLGMGVTWGVLWALIGSVIGVIAGFVTPNEWSFGQTVLDWTLGMGLYGLVSGVGFGGLLTLAEGRKRLLDLSLPKVAVLGVLGAAAVPLLFIATFAPGTTVVDIVQAMVVTSFLGGTFAPGAVALAQRAELQAGDDPDLLGHGSE